METNLYIDDTFTKEGLFHWRVKSAKDTVKVALEEFIAKRKTEVVIKMFHTVNYSPDYNYKKLRNRK